jgi:radical SAM superfamily enzyme YgiQ (UPF0313 family)
MKILLLYPEFPDTFWSLRYALPFIRKKAVMPPLGLITVAAMLPKEWELRLVDLNVRQLTDDALNWADMVFVSAMEAQRASVERLVKRCHRAGKKIVAGGPLFTSEYEGFPEVDHFVLNEAEITLPQFLSDLSDGKAERVYASCEFADIEKTPIPRWDLLDFKAYVTMAMQWTRGCPFKCEFCNVTKLFGHLPRLKTAEQMIAELESLFAAGWRSKVFFVDDNLIGNKKRLKTELLPALIDWQRRMRNRMPFFTEASINLAQDQELIGMMVKAGFDAVFIGIETPDKAALMECKKMQNVDRDMIGDIRTLQKAGLEVKGGFIVGFDSDDPSTIFERQIDFVMKSGVVTAMVGMLSAPVGTKLFERLKAAGRIQGQFTGDSVDGTTNIVPVMGLETLRSGYRYVMEHLYSPKNYYRRVRTFLRNYKAPKVHKRPDLQHLLAFFRAAWHIGLANRGGRTRYWLLLAWASVRRPRLFHLAVELAINGYHFRKVTKLHIQ